MNPLPKSKSIYNLQEVDRSEQQKMVVDSFCSQQKVMETYWIPYLECSRYEIYKIVMPEEYRKKLKLIKISTFDLRDEVIYDREFHDDDTGVSEEKALRLRGPRIPPEADDERADLWFYTDDNYFGLGLSNCKEDVVLSLGNEIIENYESKFKAKVFFEVISESVEAHIKITFPPDVPICRGIVCATTNGDEVTERILLCSNKLDFDNGDLCLDRSVLAMPLGSWLHLNFDFIANYGSIIQYKGEVTIQVPEFAAEISGKCILRTQSDYKLMDGKISRKVIRRRALSIQFKVQFESRAWIPGKMNREAQMIKEAQLKREAQMEARIKSEAHLQEAEMKKKAKMKRKAEAGGSQSRMDN